MIIEVLERMSGEDHLRRSRELAEAVNLHAALEQEKKDKAAGMKAQIDEVDKRIKKLSHIVATGEEYRPVECYDSPNLRENVMETCRQDTHKVVRTRPLTQDEIVDAKQGKLHLVDGPESAAKA